MGVLSFQVVWFLTVWRHIGTVKYLYAFYLAVITFTIIFLGFFYPSSSVDSWGHIGGFLTGLCVTLMLYGEVAEHENIKKFRIPSFIGIIVILGGALGLAMLRSTIN